ncbi:MAG: hypothetical protein KC635_28865, partial [Myxococcales bacterium]|nr:hypothetical protein [Myxococcales bacterium]
LVDALELRFRQLQVPQGEGRRGWRPKSTEVEIAPPTVLPSANNYDLDDISRVEAPPLPIDVPTDKKGAEPPPIPVGQQAPPAAPAAKKAKPAPAPAPVAEPKTKRLPEGPILKPASGPSRAVTLLYDDILWLVSINDWAAALISLERLLVMAALQGDVKEFVDVNEVKLMNVYESYLGPLEKRPKRALSTIDNTMPGGYERAEKIASVLDLVDGERDLKQILRDSDYSPLETCAALNQLRRAGVVDI